QISYNGLLWEMMPVEVKEREIPDAPVQALPEIETSVFETLGIDKSELVDYLLDNDLALIVSRNVTARDRNDRQQPFNLRVKGTDTESISKSGKVYDISQLQIYQGDLIRGYTTSNTTGRRVLPQPMHSLPTGANPGDIEHGVKISDDGSIAAFVPARRALTWELADDSGEAVVRERYWVTFQPGEIRVCASCHGINTADHNGNPPPTNTPQALLEILEHWKSLPTSPRPYSLTISTPKKIKPRGDFQLQAKGGSSTDELLLTASVNKRKCTDSKTLPTNTTTRTVTGKLPGRRGTNILFSVVNSNDPETVLAESSLKVKKRKKPAQQQNKKRKNLKKYCNVLFKSLTP
ncbi:MAG: hypothetical protein KDD60_10950, partial [Bdellovibrionales bacterium]|nr:hypothetical protein [Bdellovibrionales bacterium]